MKKIILILPIALLGCKTLVIPSVEIEYNQTDGGCVYSETYLTREFNYSPVNKDTINTIIHNEKTIKYQNTRCDKVIDSDLKNGINKKEIY